VGASLLLIEDDDDAAELVAEALQVAMPTSEVRRARTLREGMQTVDERMPDCVVLDYRLPDGTGLDGLRTLRERNPRLPVVMLTADASAQVAVEAMKLGAADYVVKQGRFVDSVPATIQAVLGQAAFAAAHGETGSCRPRDVDEVTRAYCARHGVIGQHPRFRAMLADAEQAARTQAPVLLSGESGTGKEQVARLVHDLGPRAAQPFVPINCAALPEHLVESELFGHARGAFSGADREHRGLFESAGGGTLFLDEIGDLPLALQPKLLRALQEHAVRPVGATRARQIDVRIIAASNQDLERAVTAGHFRQDLFHRLNVVPIHVPALRERREDIALLVRHFASTIAAHENRPVPRFSAEVLATLERAPWPGNVRHLENAIHRLVLDTAPGARINQVALTRHLHDAPSPAMPSTQPLRDIVRNVEVAAISERLRTFGYSRTETARSLGLTREGLWFKLRRLGLDLPKNRGH
jgi:two-component system response regulator PilR (NtrC family)